MNVILSLTVLVASSGSPIFILYSIYSSQENNLTNLQSIYNFVFAKQVTLFMLNIVDNVVYIEYLRYLSDYFLKH